MNHRLSRLFHAGYIDRPRAQLDHYPTFGSAPMVYALADLGALLIAERLGVEFADQEWGRKNHEAGRPFIEHQLGVVDFSVALQVGTRARDDIRLIHPHELIAAFPKRTRSGGNPVALRVNVSRNGKTHEIGLIPDLIFGIGFPDGSRRCFMVEVDRGTMPVSRSDLSQTSFERKMLAYLIAHTARQHERDLGWKTFRVLTVSTDDQRTRSMMETLRRLNVPNSQGPSLFFFANQAGLSMSNPLSHTWRDGNSREVRLI
jgi:hypothetical protein